MKHLKTLCLSVCLLLVLFALSSTALAVKLTEERVKCPQCGVTDLCAVSVDKDCSSTPGMVRKVTKSYTCSHCFHTWSKELDTVGHKWVNFHSDATCTEVGLTYKYCSNCLNMQYTAPVSAALGHDWQETSRTPATCVKPGSIFSTCSRCGFARSEDIPALSTAHAWEETSRTAPTDTTPGFIEYTCSVCHATRREQLPALHPDLSMTGLLGDLTSVFDTALGWVNIVAETVAANPVLLLCVVVGFFGTGVFLFKRLLGAKR